MLLQHHSSSAQVSLQYQHKWNKPATTAGISVVVWACIVTSMSRVANPSIHTDTGIGASLQNNLKSFATRISLVDIDAGTGIGIDTGIGTGIGIGIGTGIDIGIGIGIGTRG